MSARVRRQGKVAPGRLAPLPQARPLGDVVNDLDVAIARARAAVWIATEADLDGIPGEPFEAARLEAADMARTAAKTALQAAAACVRELEAMAAERKAVA